MELINVSYEQKPYRLALYGCIALYSEDPDSPIRKRLQNVIKKDSAVVSKRYKHYHKNSSLPNHANITAATATIKKMIQTICDARQILLGDFALFIFIR